MIYFKFAIETYNKVFEFSISRMWTPELSHIYFILNNCLKIRSIKNTLKEVISNCLH